MDDAPSTSSSCSTAIGADHDQEAFLAGDDHAGVLRLGAAPTSACGCCSTRWSTSRRRRAPARRRRAASRAPLDAPFSRLRVQGAGQHGPAHRDRIAFVRVCSGRFERGMVVTHAADRASRSPPSTRSTVFGHERETVEEAFPGDVVGLVNATALRVGDTLYVDEPGRRSRRSRASRPSTSRSPGRVDTGRFKQFRRGIAQLDEEGVVQVLRDPDLRRPGAGARRRRPDAVRGRAAPDGGRVRRRGHARPAALLAGPPHRRASGPPSSTGSAASRCSPAPTARCSRCSPTPGGWAGPSATSRTRSSSRSSPRPSDGPPDRGGEAQHEVRAARRHPRARGRRGRGLPRALPVGRRRLRRRRRVLRAVRLPHHRCAAVDPPLLVGLPAVPRTAGGALRGLP